MKSKLTEIVFLLFFVVCLCTPIRQASAQTNSHSDPVKQTTPKKPNVVFIIADDLTATALGCYGNAHCQTPNIDRLSKQGVRFTRCYTQNPVCGPARAALMSGTYSRTNGVWGNGQSGKFSKTMGNRPTLASHFRNNGYQTARISKIYHMRVPGDITAGVSGPDHKASWDIAINCKADEQWTEGKSHHWTKEKLRPDPERKRHYGLGYGGAFYEVQDPTDGMAQADAKAANQAEKLIKKFSKQDQPFFLAVGLVRPHVPLVAPKSDFDRYDIAKLSLPKQTPEDWSDMPKAAISKNSQSSGLKNSRQKKSVLKAYFASVTFMDRQVGKILHAIEANGLSKNTIVVFTSDHGYHLGEHEFWQKLSLHEESARIPMIIKAPGFRRSETGSLSQQIDLFPTLAGLSGLNTPRHIQGKSLVAAMRHPNEVIHDAVYCQKSRGDHLIRTNRWALMKYKKGGMELYDMEKDPNQFLNLASKSEHQDTVRKLSKKLEQKLKTLPVF